jgi:hypothetical protein
VKDPYHEDALLDQDDENILLRLESLVFDAEEIPIAIGVTGAPVRRNFLGGAKFNPRICPRSPGVRRSPSVAKKTYKA